MQSWEFDEFKSFHEELLKFLENYQRVNSLRLNYDTKDSVTYESFETMLNTLVDGPFEKEKCWNLYYIFCGLQEDENNPIIYGFFHELRSRISLKPDHQDLDSLILSWLGEINHKRLTLVNRAP